MESRLNFRLSVVMVKIVIMVTVMNIIGIVAYVTLDYRYSISDKILVTRNDIETTDAFMFTKNFKGYVEIEDWDKINLKETGKKLLEDRGYWFQLIDESGNEIYSYNTSDEISKHYDLYDFSLKYEYSRPDTIFVEQLKHNGRKLSYIVGFPSRDMGKFFLAYGVEHVERLIVLFIVLTLVMSAVVSAVMAFFYSKKITVPMHSILNRIDLLSNNVYHHESNDDPFYSDVYENLNKLSGNLQQAEEEREEMEKLKSEWISNISHDIKTPLASIRGYSEILKDYELSEEEIKKYGDILNEKSIYIEELLGELRLSDRLKDKDVSLNLDKTNLVEFSRGLIAEILNSEENNISIEFHSNLAEIYKDIDQFMFKRVFENLIYNAIYYSKEDIQIDVTVEDMDDKIRMKFRDNGIGIKEEDLKNIFNRYYRGSNTKKKGTGLGLAITKDVVERHGGTIEVASTLNEFTEFTIVFKK